MRAVRISYMEHNDIQASAQVLSQAMLNNPLHVAIFQGNREKERLKIESIFLKLFQERPGILLVAKDHDKIIGVMRMISCVGKDTASEPRDLTDLRDVESRQALWLSEWAKRDPKEQHWHLGPIGVLASHRRSGVGTRLMELFCKEVDKCAATAYLETDLDENVSFYQKFGFELIATAPILEVENKYMLRPSRK